MGDVSAPLRWIRETDKRIEDLEHWSPESLTKASLNLNERVKTLESERHNEGNERREMEASLLNRIETRRCETNELKKRVGELEGQSGAFLEPWVSHLEKRINDYSKRIEGLEKLHYKGVAPIDEKGYHNWPESEPHTCEECKHPFYRSDYGLCRSHPVVKKSCQPIAIWREHEACENFKGEV